MQTRTKFSVLAVALAVALGGARMIDAAPLQAGDGQEKVRQLAELPALAQQSVSADAPKSRVAIAKLRQAGLAGMVALEIAHESTLRQAYSHPERKKSAEWKRVAAAFEKVGAQRDNWASRLYWFTDLEAAKAEAKKQNKPILSLRLLGNLDDELSCANSRFFRTALYPNTRIKQFLGEHYILHWQSVRPVPKVTIDFGDGRKIETTITGNSIHYALDNEGRVLDALPGLHGPGAFFEWLERTQNLTTQIAQQTGAERLQFLNKYHNERLNQLTREWQNDFGRARLAGSAAEYVVGTIRGPALPAALPVQSAQGTNLRQVAQAVQRPLANTNNTRSAAPLPADEMLMPIRPTARNASPIALTKRFAEGPLLSAITVPVPRDREALARQTDDALWGRIGTLHLAQAKLDNKSLEVLRTKTDRADQVAVAFEKAIAEDTVRNEYSRHATIHQWLVQNPGITLDALNQRVYSEMFLTPDSDPWLGLLPAEAYNAIANNGIVAPE